MSAADLFIKIETLPSELRNEVEAFIDCLLKRKEEPQRKQIPFGKFKGKVQMAKDFDVPLDVRLC